MPALRRFVAPPHGRGKDFQRSAAGDIRDAADVRRRQVHPLRRPGGGAELVARKVVARHQRVIRNFDLGETAAGPAL